MLQGGSEDSSLARRPIVIPLTIEPRTDASAAQRGARPGVDSARRPRGDDAPDPAPRPAQPTRMGPPPTTLQSPTGLVVDQTLRERIARSLRSRLSRCSGEGVDAEDRLACETRLASAADRPRPFSGSGDLRRDRAFARQGAAALAAYEQRRAPLNANDEVACVAVGPLADCARVEVELYSSTRGVLPNLRR